MTGLCACSAQPLSTVTKEPTPVPQSAEMIVPAPTPIPAESFGIVPAPSIPVIYPNEYSLNITDNVLESGSNYLVLPHVTNCADADYYNECIFSLAEAALIEVDRPVCMEYSIESCNEAILSLALRFYDMESGMPCGIYPITFDLSSAQVQHISDYFSVDDDRWRRILPDIATQQAKKYGITLLSELLPISDEQGFYIRGDELVLIYHPYEIATYAAGVPEFAIPISSLEMLLREDSPLTKILSNTESDEVLYDAETSAEIAK